MSDTPRTSTAAYNGHTYLLKECQQLERENKKMRELLSDVIFDTVDARTYPDGPCLDKHLRDDIKLFLQLHP